MFVLLQSAAFSGVFTGFGVARDFEGGFAKRLMLAAPRRSGIVLGYALAALVRWSIVAVLLTVIAFVVGMNVGGGAVDLVGLYTLAALVNFCGFFWAGGIAMRLPDDPGRAAHADARVPHPLLRARLRAARISSKVGSTASRRVNPVTYLLETGRGFVAGDAPHIAGAFAIAIGLGLLFWVWAFRGLRNAEAAGAKAEENCAAAKRPPSGISRPVSGASRMPVLHRRAPQQRVDDLRVELRARGLDESPPRLFLAERLAVRAVGRHRVEGVAGEDDPRLERDLLARQVVRIAGAVVVLVRAADDEPDLAELLDRREDALAEDRDASRRCARSSVVERPGLREDPGRDADLADVVEERAELETLQLARLEAELLADSQREVGDPARV